MSSFKKVLLLKVVRCSYQFFYFLFYIRFYISRCHFFYNFLELHPTLSEKDFCHKFSWTDLPKPLISQNLLSMIEVFSQFSLKCLLKYIFFQTVVDKLTNLLNCYCTYILKVPTADSLVFFSEHVSRKTILTQASVIIYKYNS